MNKLSITVECDLQHLPNVINALQELGSGVTHIVGIDVLPDTTTMALETPLPWKRPSKPLLKPMDGAIGLLTEFIGDKGVGATFRLNEAQRLFTQHGYSVHSTSARLSECCQAGALELIDQGAFMVKKILTAQEIKQKRNKY
jgi:hypothetical protein